MQKSDCASIFCTCKISVPNSLRRTLCMQESDGIDDRQPHQRWQGRSTQFMQSNQHSGDRGGVWATEGLQGPALAIVEGDRDGAR